MTVRFWGTRGTIAVPGPGTVRYGGDTSCVSVETENAVLVIDAGTGIRHLGDWLAEDSRDIYVLLTHVHMDHVQGFPMFTPLWQPGRRIRLLTHTVNGRPWSPLSQFDGIHFPVRAEFLPSDVQDVDDDPIGYLAEGGFDVSRLPVNHPGGAFGFRVRTKDAAFVHIPDNEISCDHVVTPFEELVEFCRGAQILSHDAQLLAEELPAKSGWGHSSVREACALAQEAGVERLLLFHHDPWRDDEAMDALVERARDELRDTETNVEAARDGMVVEL